MSYEKDANYLQKDRVRKISEDFRNFEFEFDLCGKEGFDSFDGSV